MLIRWIGAEAPVLAYFKSFPLLAAFLGMGVGARLADRRDLSLLAPLALLALGLMLGRAGSLGAATLALADPNLEVWRPAEVAGVGPALAFGLVLLVLMAVAFVALGQVVGRLIESAPALLRGYGLDLAGGFMGALASLAMASLPPAWLLPLGTVGFALASASRRALLVSLGSLAIPLVATDARWSPYYRIDLEPHQVSGVPLGERLSVNRDVHQLMLDLSDENLRAHESVVAPRRRRYSLPWTACALPDHARVLVAGAGTGNDVAEALRHAPSELVAVELDPTIAAIGRERHPERPYSAGVTLVADDARAAFERLRGARFSVLVYGLIDAHASLAAFGSLRHEEFVYTVEGIRAGLAALDEHGIACMTFFERGRRWLGDRITASIREATGTTPIVTMARGEGTLYFFFGPGLDRDATRARLASLALTDEGEERLARHATPTTDDWPFLYANPDGLPILYLSALAALVLATLATVLHLRAGGTSPLRNPLAIRGRAPATRSDIEMVLLGAAFLLVETTRITELARLFGATWIVTGIVIAGIFLVLLLANGLATKVPPRLAPVAGVLAAIALVLPVPDLLALPLLERAVLASLLAALPLGFAGVAFSRAFAAVPRGAQALGANLAGAALGGGLEALVLVVGLRHLAWLAATLYVTWAALHASRGMFETRPDIER